MYVPGFQRQVFKYDPKCKWFPLTNFQWIPRTNNCNVNFVGPLVFLRIPQRANINSCFGFRKSKRIAQIYADSAYFLRIPLTICGFHLQSRIQRQVKLFKHIYYNLFMDFTNSFRIPHILLLFPQSCLFLERLWALHCLSYLSMKSKTTENIKEQKQWSGFRNISDFFPFAEFLYNAQKAQFRLLMSLLANYLVESVKTTVSSSSFDSVFHRSQNWKN